MRKFEVLSPAGDLDSFNIAIKSGADAVYIGLPKFNARMKADNIGLDNLANVVEFAHLRNVKVYVTLNTLVSSSEMRELIEMVGIAHSCGVDAFIVQDYGVISVLKSVYPNIELHGSTQLGVHNVRGARVAKSMGLSRVVLSREVGLDEIRAIKQSVDIELEVFVQGAMCVCFSGNCYMSSLKHGASGNRGMCKQLCRLPYTLSTKGKSKSGFMLSPRDNCMLDYLKELCEIGVHSFKIEGRLRRSGYVGVATRIYRNAIDKIVKGRDFDVRQAKSDLSKVFSRGEFVNGYFDGNMVIDTTSNNHKGLLIGEVVGCQKFKDIYRITIKAKEDIHSGDGLRIVSSDNSEVTLGVGNVDKNGCNYTLYGKNFCSNNSKVYRVLDSLFESKVEDILRVRVVDVSVRLGAGSPIALKLVCDGIEVECFGAKVQEAKSKPLTKENLVGQLSKFGEDCFVIGNTDIKINGDVFLPVSEINAIRRDAIMELRKKILEACKLKFDKRELPNLVKAETSFDSLAIVDEGCQISKLVDAYSALILSPSVYSLPVLKKFFDTYKRFFTTPLILNLPVIAMNNDLVIVDELVKFAIDNGIILLANNIYVLDYISQGAIVWAGAGMNVVNDYSVSALKQMGVGEIVSSIEKWCQMPTGTYKMCDGRKVLMTMVHCPNKTLVNKCCIKDGSCGECYHKSDLTLSHDGGEYSLRRYVVSKCYFELVDSFRQGNSSQSRIDDLR